MNSTDPTPANNLYIIVPFYKRPEVCRSFFEALQECRQELKDLGCTIVAVNDSPKDEGLASALGSAAREFSSDLPFVLLENTQNLGFVKSANRGLREALKAAADTVLLNSDTIVFPGSLREMRQVAYLDPMVGFVSPRSNNASMFSFPVQPEFETLPPSDAHGIFLELSSHLPRFHYVPTAVGFCMFIKREILTEFGILDEVYGSGDNAENDWVMRANRCGYRTALANHAFVYHSGEASSFISETPKTIQEDTNRAILTSHYPEYPERVRAYFDSAHYRAEKLLVGLLKDTRGRHDVVFDFSNFGPHHNGTFEAAKQILKHAAETWHRDFNIHVIAYEAAARFHALDKIGGVLLLAPTTHRVFAIAFRFGQPFQCDALLRMSRLAVINVYAMLDPIAWDCLYLNTPDLDEIWKAVFSYADAITYISDFVGNQFHLRFRPHSRLKELSCYLSLDLSEYTSSRPGTCEGQNDHLSDESQPGGYLLVIGNHLAHKHVAPTVQALSQKLPRQKIVALGMEGTRLHNVTGYASGHLSEDKLESLFANAAVVIFPSFYEGFGIPILRSLAFRKPLFARSIPVNRDLFKRLGQPESFVLYDSTDDLIMRLCNGLPNWKNSVEPTGSKHTWASLVLQLRSLFKDLLQSVSFQDVLLPRLEHLLILEKVSDLTRSNAERDLQLRDLQRQISDLQVTVHDREARIEDLLSSMSWTVTAPLRSAAKAWLRAIDAVRSSNGRERK